MTFPSDRPFRLQLANIPHVSYLIEFFMRISAISYLNTAPLVWDFEQGLADPSFEISYTIPSQCAMELQNGIVDVGLIPAAAYATIPRLSILPGVAIASKRAVRSILLVSHKPLEKIATVALDSSSLTSAALTRVLFRKYWGERKFTSLPPNLENMLAEHDAALLIGDHALKVDRSNYHTWDLAEEWTRFTNKPFVFAFWAVRDRAAKISGLDLPAIFQRSRDHGLRPDHLAEITRAWAAKLNLAEKDVHEYLTSNIHYYLDESCLEGLRLFYRYARECDALPSAPELHFTEPSPVSI